MVMISIVIKHSKKHDSHAEFIFELRLLCSQEKDWVPKLELTKTSALNGDLDTQIQAAALKLRDGFAQ
jgi:hypothetical protein